MKIYSTVIIVQNSIFEETVYLSSCKANSEDEAIGLTYKLAMEKFPADFYFNHEINVVEVSNDWYELK